MACGCENTREIFPDCDMNRWETQCSSYIVDADNYYTKPQIDEMLEEIESAITSGCCITPEEVDEKIDEAVSGKQDTLSAGTNIIISGNVISASGCDLTDYYTKEQVDAKIPSLNGYATEQWVLDKHYITGVDLSDYATKQWVEDKHYITGVDLSNYATQNWVLSQNYVVYTEFIQYITNLQNQIDALRAQISGCCADTGTTLTRWITMTGSSDYCCSGTTKMTKEEEEQSTDGGNTWVSTGNYRTGSTVIEANSIDCGYTPSNPKLYATYNTSETLTIQCNGQPLGQLEPQHGGSPYIGNMLTVEIGGCAEEITNDTFGTIATNLRSVVINEGVEYIGQSAFQDLSNLSAVTIPNSVTGISSYAFSGCTKLTNCTIGSGVTNIQANAFNNCRSMSGSVDLPNVTTIDSGAFKNCKNLTSINIGSGITSIGGYMVDGCSGLTGITINAETPPSINWFTFANSTCPIYVPSASVNAYKTGHSNWQHYADRIQAIPTPTKFIAYYNQYSANPIYSAECDSNTALTTATTRPSGYETYNMLSAEVGDCITSIGEMAFNQCYNITAITIGSGVTAIGNFAFGGCTELKGGITINATVPPSLGFLPFDNTNDCAIYVPSGSVNAYKSAWTDVSSRIQAIP